MKRLFFTLYAAMFHLFRVFPVQKKRVALISMHNADFHDGLGEVERAFQGKKEGYFFTKITRRDLCLQTNAGPVAFLRSVCRAIGFLPESLWASPFSLYFSQ